MKTKKKIISGGETVKTTLKTAKADYNYATVTRLSKEAKPKGTVRIGKAKQYYSTRKSRTKLVITQSAKDLLWYVAQVSMANGKTVWDGEGSARRGNAIKRVLNYRKAELKADKQYLLQVVDSMGNKDDRWV